MRSLNFICILHYLSIITKEEGNSINAMNRMCQSCRNERIIFILFLCLGNYIYTKEFTIFNLILELKTLKITNKTMVFVSPRT